MNYFSQSEFREWFDLMSPRLLTMLDVLRHTLDQPIEISAHKDALGRRLGMQNQSAHNVDVWGESLAADVFINGVESKEDALQVVNAARRLGFTGIGVYPTWRNNKGLQQVGFHFDVRPTRKMGNPSQWGFIGAKMVDIHTALEAIKNE